MLFLKTSSLHPTPTHRPALGWQRPHQILIQTLSELQHMAKNEEAQTSKDVGTNKRDKVYTLEFFHSHSNPSGTHP